MILESFPQLHSLSAREKAMLADELWEEAAQQGGLSDERISEIVSSNYENYLKNPDRVRTWEEVRKRIRSGKVDD